MGYIGDILPLNIDLTLSLPQSTMRSLSANFLDPIHAFEFACDLLPTRTIASVSVCETLPDLPISMLTFAEEPKKKKEIPYLSNVPPGIRAFCDDALRAERNFAESAAAEIGVRDRLSSLYAEAEFQNEQIAAMERVVAEELSPTVLGGADDEIDEEIADGDVDLTQIIFETLARLGIDLKALKAKRKRLCFTRSMFELEEADDDDCRRHSKKQDFCRRLSSLLNSKDQIGGRLKLGKILRVWYAVSADFKARKHFALVTEIPFQTPSRDRSLIFISEEATQNAVESRSTREFFTSSKQLFHYLRWTIKMQQIDAFYKVLRVEKNGRDAFEVVLFNTELHRRNNGCDDASEVNGLDALFIVGIKNDRVSLKSPKWKMDSFATAREVCEKYGISAEWLPVGSRRIGRAFGDLNRQRRYREVVISGWLRRESESSSSKMLASAVVLRWCFYFFDPFSRLPQYLQGATTVTQGVYGTLPQIKTLQKKEKHRLAPCEMRVSTSDFCKFISAAMSNELMRIVSFDKHKTVFHIDLLLPVRLPSNADGTENWIGIIFRDNNPSSICIDCNDIRTKSKLFDALCDVDRFEWLQNRITKLTVFSPNANAHRRDQFAHGAPSEHSRSSPRGCRGRRGRGQYQKLTLDSPPLNSPPRLIHAQSNADRHYSLTPPHRGPRRGHGYAQTQNQYYSPPRHGYAQAQCPSTPRLVQSQSARRAHGRDYVQPPNYSPRHEALLQKQQRRNCGRMRALNHKSPQSEQEEKQSQWNYQSARAY